MTNLLSFKITKCLTQLYIGKPPDDFVPNNVDIWITFHLFYCRPFLVKERQINTNFASRCSVFNFYLHRGVW